MDIKISKASGNDITLVVTPQAKQTIVIDRTASKGTVTSVAAVGGTGISVTGSPITSDGTLTITNTAPDQTVALTAGTGITTSGTYPNFTITNSAPDRTVAFTNGTGISTTGTYPNFTITNTAPDQTVALTGAGTTTVTGTYPNFTITSTGASGTVTGVTGTAPIVSSGGTTPAISITSSGANSAVLRDSNLNISANSISEGYSNVAAAGTTTILTAASVPNYVVTGSGGQTYQLPNATTLANGTNYQFNNNQSSGTIVVKNNSGTTVATIQSGGFVDVSLLSNATAAGSWDTHNIAPSNVSWSTNTFDYAGSITSATWNGATIAVNRGGTGASTLTGYVKGSGTTALTASASIPVADINATGIPSSTTYLRGDSTWSTIPAGMVYPSAGIPNSTGSAWGTSYGVTGTGSVVLSNSPVLTGNVSANVNLRYDILANLLNLAGGNYEIGYATDANVLVKFNGTAGGAVILGNENGGTVNISLNPTNYLAYTTTGAGQTFIDCSKASRLIISFSSDMTGISISNLNVQMPSQSVSGQLLIPKLEIIMGNGFNVAFASTFTITLAYAADDVANGINYYVPIAAEGLATTKPTFKFLGAQYPAYFNVQLLQAPIQNGWTRLPLVGESTVTYAPAVGYIGEKVQGTTNAVTLTTSGTVYSSGSISLSAGLWMITGGVTFNVTSTNVATTLAAAIGLNTVSQDPSVSTLSSCNIPINNSLGTQIKLSLAPTIVAVSSTTNTSYYANAKFIAGTGNSGTITASVYHSAYRIA